VTEEQDFVLHWNNIKKMDAMTFGLWLTQYKSVVIEHQKAKNYWHGFVMGCIFTGLICLIMQRGG